MTLDLTFQESTEALALDIAETTVIYENDYDNLANRPKYNGATINSATDIPEVKTSVWDGKQDALIAGTNIAIANNVISAEGTTYTAGEGITITDDVISNDVSPLVPNQATEQNQLADKAFVNSTIQTATANFRGTWNTFSAVPTDSSQYPEDYAGSRIPTVNDYIAVIDASDFSGQTLSGTWRFKYTGIWATSGKSGWLPEYKINDAPMTAAQLASLNSGATSAIISSVSAKEVASNKVTSLSATSSDVQYPSAKCVYDIVGNVESLLEALL